jgi:predicted transposase YbfD/YdcC
MHWRVENSLHWTLDIVFNEDSNSKEMAGLLKYKLDYKLSKCHQI